MASGNARGVGPSGESVITYLRAILGTLDDHARNMDEIIRLGRADASFTRRDIANLEELVHADMVSIRKRLESLSRRITRLERLVIPPATPVEPPSEPPADP